MFAPRHAYEYGEGSPPPLGVRDYPMLGAHSPQIDAHAHEEKLEYRHDHEEKYTACALQEEPPRYAAPPEDYDKCALVPHDKHYEMERHAAGGDISQPVVIKMEPTGSQAYTTLPPFLN